LRRSQAPLPRDERMEPFCRHVLSGTSSRAPLTRRGPKIFSMKIRAGYEISYDCPQPTPMILMLSIHPSRIPDLLTPDHMRLDPPIPANTYHDVFGNFCHVIRAPRGPVEHVHGLPDAGQGRAGRDGP